MSDKMREALKLAIRQNEHDMLMTGEELRLCRDAIAQAEQRGEVIPQYRRRGAIEWYDGYADHEDSCGQYEERVVYTAPQEQAEQRVPRLSIRCETSDGIAHGVNYLNVVRVEQEDDGSYTAVTDHWPFLRSPAPVAADDVAKDAARYRWLRDQDYDSGCVIAMEKKYILRFVNYSKAIDNYIDAAMLASAPEVNR